MSLICGKRQSMITLKEHDDNDDHDDNDAVNIS